MQFGIADGLGLASTGSEPYSLPHLAQAVDMDRIVLRFVGPRGNDAIATKRWCMLQYPDIKGYKG
jgi:hypothetical protein